MLSYHLSPQPRSVPPSLIILYFSHCNTYSHCSRHYLFFCLSNTTEHQRYARHCLDNGDQMTTTESQPLGLGLTLPIFPTAPYSRPVTASVTQEEGRHIHSAHDGDSVSLLRKAWFLCVAENLLYRRASLTSNTISYQKLPWPFAKLAMWNIWTRTWYKS